MERQRSDEPPSDSSVGRSPKPKRARNGPAGSRSTRWIGTFNDRIRGRDTAACPEVSGDAASSPEEEAVSQADIEADDEGEGGRRAGDGVEGNSMQLLQSLHGWNEFLQASSDFCS